jgi:transposase
MSRRKHKAAQSAPQQPPPTVKSTTRTPAPAPDSAPLPDRYRDSLPVRHRHAAGIDVGSRSHWVAAPATDGSIDTIDVAEFDTYTDGLLALVAWLRERGVTTVALEATGIYGDPLFDLLQAEGFEVIQVNPAYTAQLKGRPKTDKLDCQWIRRLHAHGLLPASFRPAAEVAVLRAYLRQRADLVRAGGRHIQHLQKALELMNVKLTEVVSDVTSVTGLKIIRAILAGERDPLTLARLRDKHCKNSTDTFARALHGSWRDEHLLSLRLALASWEHYQAQQRELEDVIARHLHQMKKAQVLPPLPPKPRVRGRSANEPRFDVRTALYYVTGVDLTELDGIAEVTALVVVSEIGLDMTRFPSVKHFCAWLGLCPRLKKTGGRVISSRTRKGKGRAARALCLAARALWHSQTAMGSYLRRLKARLGAPMATTATAHKLARLLYQTLKTGTLPAKETAAAYAARQRQQAVATLTKKALRLGLRVVATGEIVEGVPSPQ